MKETILPYKKAIDSVLNSLVSKWGDEKFSPITNPTCCQKIDRINDRCPVCGYEEEFLGDE